ncbi:MAG: peptidylprolyl isomerase [Anaerolineae bacterium]|nr:peptidylprolyl isomerase [Anaerolineae bacterium]
MSKKGQTSGMPKATPPDPKQQSAKKQPRLIKEYHTKAERDAAVQRWLLIGTGIVVAVAAALIVIALIGAAVTPTQAAATVNGETITVGDLQRTVRLERAIRNLELNNAVAQYRAMGVTDDQIMQFIQSQPPFSTWISEESVPEQLGSTVLRQIIEQRLINSAAAADGVTVDDAGVDSFIQDFFGYDPNAALITPTPTSESTASPTPLVSPTPTLTPTATLTPEFTPTASLTPAPSSTPPATLSPTEVAGQFETSRGNFFAAIRSQTNLSDADIRTYFAELALTKVLRDHVTADLSREAAFFNTRVIEVDSEARANEIVAALAAGELFGDLARANSSNQSAASGGELGWMPLTELAATFGTATETALTGASTGAVIGPVMTDAGTWVVLQVRGSEPRTMTDAEFEQAKTQAFEEYVAGLRDAATTSLTDAWIGNVPLDPRLSISQAQ